MLLEISENIHLMKQKHETLMERENDGTILKSFDTWHKVISQHKIRAYYNLTLIDPFSSGVKTYQKGILKEGSIVICFDTWQKVIGEHKIKVYL